MANATSKQQPKITPATKVAAIIIALGADSASEVYKYLRDEEIEEITSEISRIDLLSSDDMKEIIDDFYDMCITQKVVTEGGETYAKEVLEKAFGAQRSAYLMEQIVKSGKVRAGSPRFTEASNCTPYVSICKKIVHKTARNITKIAIGNFGMNFLQSLMTSKVIIPNNKESQ